MTRAQDLLAEYRKKRDFSKTSEPKGSTPSQTGNIFVVQKHDATRLHYDFRLEYEGVLKSWAVTRGPSSNPADKRLAVRTEDHPLDYATFEGIIPQGEYGGGTVMLWDFGTWEPIEDPKKGLKSGKLKFRLDGERMKGGWTLVRMAKKPGEKRENWLLIKERDEAAKDKDTLTRPVTSVSTGRKMEAIAKGKPSLKNSKDQGKTPALPKYLEPQLATLVDTVPTGEDWLFEMKYDGYRSIAAIAGDKVKLYTRNGHDWTEKFSVLVAPMSVLTKGSALIDGEICAFDGEGKTSFSTLKKHLSEGGPLTFFAFDLLEQDGKSLTNLPQTERKAALEQLIGKQTRHAPIQLSPDIRGKGEEVFAAVCKAGHEGIIAKKADARYRSGRGANWLKVKCTRRQEFVIGGYSPTDKKARPFSSVLIGVQDNGKFVYKGRVGSFSGGTLEELGEALKGIERKTSPFASLPREASRDAKFVRPELVVEVDFAEFTADGVVRHGVVKGIRGDKDAAEVVLEAAGGQAMASHETRDRIAGVKLSSPDKVLFEEQGVTKADLAAHYERVAARMLPLVEGRLVSLVRCPQGEGGQCFFQRHDHKGFPAAMKRQEITEKDGGKATYLRLDTLSSLIAGVQMGTLEFHIWGSSGDMLEKPDRLVFDLDPDEGLGFGDVKEASFDIRDRLAELGLKTVPLVTGGKGVHVIAPLTRHAEWPEVKGFARGFARMLAAEAPERYVAQASKAKRKGRIFVDWLRNERGATAIAPYSTRSRQGAPVAVPVSWDELQELEAANQFRITDMEDRLKAADPWADAGSWRQSITKKMLDTVDAEID